MAQRNGSHAGGAEARRPQDDRPLVTGPSLGPIPYHWVAAIVVIVGTFLGVLDSTITNIALPTLGKTFDRPDEDVIWVALSFIVVSTGLSLTMGRLGDLYGRKMLYVLGFGLFTIALALSAVSSNLEQLGRQPRADRDRSVDGPWPTAPRSSPPPFPPSKRGTGLGLIVSTVGAGRSRRTVSGRPADRADRLARHLLATDSPSAWSARCWPGDCWSTAPASSGPRVSTFPARCSCSDCSDFSRSATQSRRGSGLDLERHPGHVSPPGLVCLLLFIRTERRADSPVVDLALFKGTRLQLRDHGRDPAVHGRERLALSGLLPVNQRARLLHHRGSADDHAHVHSDARLVAVLWTPLRPPRFAPADHRRDADGLHGACAPGDDRRQHLAGRLRYAHVAARHRHVHLQARPTPP